MLEIGKANEVKFKVGVNGTNSEPSVRLVIGTLNAELGFKAEKLIGGADGEWFSEVKLPEEMAAGEYDFRVEVVINNRLFTPIKRKVTVGRVENVMAAESQKPATPTQKPEQTETWEGEGGALSEVPEKPQPLPSAPLDPLKDETPPPKPKSLMSEAAAKDGTTPYRPGKKVEPVVQPKPVKQYKMPELKVKAEPVRITMADIAAEGEKRFGNIVKESASYKSPAVSVTPINIQHQMPVKLTKGDIVYE